MTDALYLKDSYLREFETIVKEVNKDRFIVLKKTAFYPQSGGQPYDTGVMETEEGAYRVVFAGKFSGKISHEVDRPSLSVGDKVICRVDWERRYNFMRQHTASHMLSTLIHNETGAQITGNQIAEEKTRIDFNLETFDRESLKEYEAKANHLMGKGLDVNIRFLDREEAFKIPSVVKLKMALPESLKTIRIVDIQGFDQQACGGTHVRNTSEIGRIEIFKAENKGKNNRRVYFRLV